MRTCAACGRLRQMCSAYTQMSGCNSGRHCHSALLYSSVRESCGSLPLAGGSAAGGCGRCGCPCKGFKLSGEAESAASTVDHRDLWQLLRLLQGNSEECFFQLVLVASTSVREPAYSILAHLSTRAHEKLQSLTSDCCAYGVYSSKSCKLWQLLPRKRWSKTLP